MRNEYKLPVRESRFLWILFSWQSTKGNWVFEDKKTTATNKGT